jgi:saccharopine dehydrogenase-like NADP-dependent oxidoreductase
MKLLVLGCGNVGAVIVRDLVRSRCEVIVGDASRRNLEKAKEEHGDKIETRLLNVTDETRLAKAMNEVEATVNSTSYAFNLHVLRAAISAKRDLADLGGLFHMTLKELKYDRRAKERGISAVVGMGDDPGTSNIMANLGYWSMDSVDEIKVRWGSSSQTAKSVAFGFSVATCLDEASMNAMIFSNGRYKEVPPLSEGERTSFPKPIGELNTYAILHSELATLPTSFKGIRNVSYKDSWDKDTLSIVHFLRDSGLASRDEVEVRGRSVSPRDLLLTLLSPNEPKGTIGCLKVQVVGRKGESSSSSSYLLGPVSDSKEGRATVTQYTTAIPASIVGQMLANGSVEEDGVVPPEALGHEEVSLFLKEMRARGLRVKETA